MLKYMYNNYYNIIPFLLLNFYVMNFEVISINYNNIIVQIFAVFCLVNVAVYFSFMVKQVYTYYAML